MTIALRFVAPVQAWGDVARFRNRTSALAPSKSGVVGLIASAMGRDRLDDVSDLAGLEMAVRIDSPGRLASDFQTVDKGGPHREISTRYYLEDAAFLVVLTGSSDLEEQIETALRAPKRMLGFGRRSCVPSAPIFALRTDETVNEVLANHPYVGQNPVTREWYDVVRDLREDDDVEAEFTSVTHDVPLSFDSAYRRYAGRIVVWTHVPSHLTAEPTPSTDDADLVSAGVSHVDL